MEFNCTIDEQLIENLEFLDEFDYVEVIFESRKVIDF